MASGRTRRAANDGAIPSEVLIDNINRTPSANDNLKINKPANNNRKKPSAARQKKPLTYQQAIKAAKTGTALAITESKIVPTIKKQTKILEKQTKTLGLQSKTLTKIEGYSKATLKATNDIALTIKKMTDQIKTINKTIGDDTDNDFSNMFGTKTKKSRGNKKAKNEESGSGVLEKFGLGALGFGASKLGLGGLVRGGLKLAFGTPQGRALLGTAAGLEAIRESNVERYNGVADGVQHNAGTAMRRNSMEAFREKANEERAKLGISSLPTYKAPQVQTSANIGPSIGQPSAPSTTPQTATQVAPGQVAWSPSSGAAVQSGASSAKMDTNVPYSPGLENTSALKNKKGRVISTAETNLPAHQRALLDTVAYGEAPTYSTLLGGSQFEGYEKHPGRTGKATTAAGRYQFLEGTWKNTVEAFNKKNPNDPITDFSPRNQDRAAFYLAQQDYKRRTNGRDLNADLQSSDPEVKNNLGNLIKSGLGGVGNNTTWQAFQKMPGDKIQSLYDQNLKRNTEYADPNKKTPTGSTIGDNTLQPKPTATATSPGVGEEQPTGLRVKGGMNGQAFAGGQTHPGVMNAAEFLQSEGKVNRFTAFNDNYHKGTNSAHARGLAMDFSLKTPAEAAQVAQSIRAELKKRGISGRVIDEYNNPSSRATAGHIHVQFDSAEEAAKFKRTVPQDKTKTPEQAAGQSLGIGDQVKEIAKPTDMQSRSMMGYLKAKTDSSETTSNETKPAIVAPKKSYGQNKQFGDQTPNSSDPLSFTNLSQDKFTDPAKTAFVDTIKKTVQDVVKSQEVAPGDAEDRAAAVGGWAARQRRSTLQNSALAPGSSPFGGLYNPADIPRFNPNPFGTLQQNRQVDEAPTIGDRDFAEIGKKLDAIQDKVEASKQDKNPSAPAAQPYGKLETEKPPNPSSQDKAKATFHGLSYIEPNSAYVMPRSESM